MNWSCSGLILCALFIEPIHGARDHCLVSWSCVTCDLQLMNWLCVHMITSYWTVRTVIAEWTVPAFTCNYHIMNCSCMITWWTNPVYIWFSQWADPVYTIICVASDHLVNWSCNHVIFTWWTDPVGLCDQLVSWSCVDVTDPLCMWSWVSELILCARVMTWWADLTCEHAHYLASWSSVTIA